jgi:hypothetical protein
MSEINEIARKYPEHYVCEKMLWYKDIGIEINSFKDDPRKLDYLSAFKKLDKKISDLERNKQ